jgi:hypothetical protein
MKFSNQRNKNVAPNLSELLTQFAAQSQQHFGETVETMFSDIEKNLNSKVTL